MLSAISTLRRHARWYAAAGALAVFGILTARLLLDGDAVDALDRRILLGLAGLRQPWLNGVAVDVTAIGSVTLILLATAIGIAGFAAVGDRRACAQLLLSSGGGLLWAALAKETIGRARPDVVDKLVRVSTYSYPSGHSLSSAALLMTLALLVMRHIQPTAGRVAVLAAAVLVTGAVGLSRMYLGVHYPSDVAAGVALGFAWALLLAAAFLSIASRSSSSSVARRPTTTSQRREGTAAEE